ncbi:hypothetical protein M3629_03865 [Paenibacillus polysaccharolyticus]|uniref:hypothetical protein n=1 Tax=Paenibacillus polysaccharolyticus TaxID=582692 RepID=UPI00204065DE|nr:hypothetical protein [Paenibacillus polysaccharolyticus]MCM3131905.1 hypothetical protein [Paenibacillus polysaccharolyticus]
MATVTSTLKMMDAMTGPLKSVTSSMNMVISSMQQMQRVANSNMNIDKTLAAAKKQLASAEADIASAISKSTQEQNHFNNSMKAGEHHGEGLLSSVKGIVAAYLSLGAAKGLFEKTIGTAADQRYLQDMFSARTGNADIGAAMFQEFSKEALRVGADVSEYLQGTLGNFSVTMNTDKLKQLNLLAKQLSAFDTTGQGIEGAFFSLKEALSGDIVSLSERFNMSKSLIRQFGVDQLGKSGDLDGFIVAFNKLLDAQNMGHDAFERMLDSPIKKFEILQNNIGQMFSNAGQSALQALLPLIDMMNTAFQSGAFDPFFEGLSNGLTWVANAAVETFNIIGQIYNFFSTNWGTIQPIIHGIAAAMGVWYLATKAQVAIQMAQSVWTGITTAAIFIQTAATTGLAGAWTMLNAAMKANIIIAIIALVAGLATYIYHLWKTNDAFAAGFMRTWNAILNFFSSIPAYFWTVVEGITKAFSWMAKSVGGIFDTVINSIISGINSVLGLINSLTGSSYEIAAKFSFENIADDALSYAGAQKDAAYSTAAAKAAEREQAVVDMLNSRQAERDAASKAAEATKNAGGAKPFDFSAWNKAADAARTPVVDDGKKKNIGKVDKVGKIEKEVDISSEDLKTMRELAEMKNIQNFVSLTPTIQVTTGDITNGTDIDTIISNLVDVMNNEISTHASGVYGNGR